VKHVAAANTAPTGSSQYCIFVRLSRKRVMLSSNALPLLLLLPLLVAIRCST
jgi:hypothetical protein